MVRIRIDTAAIVDGPSFHAVWQSALGFPDFYGANLDAWIDCLSYLREEDAAGMARVHLAPDEMLIVELTDAESWRRRLPELSEALWDCTTFVNRRYTELGEPPAIALVPIAMPIAASV